MHADTVGGRGNWTSEGCVAVYSESNDTVQCHCNHLTNFAILVVREVASFVNQCSYGQPEPKTLLNFTIQQFRNH